METEIKDPQALSGAATTAHTRRRYDLIAPLYDLLEGTMERARYGAWRAALWETVRREAGGGTVRVLELGVGTGKNIPYYPEAAHVTAVDLSAAMLSRARDVARRHPHAQVELHEMDVQRLDFPDITFDLVVATFVFCSVPDPVRGLKEALRVTRPGGRLLLLEHMIATTPALARLMTWLDPFFHWLTGVHVARHTVENVWRSGWIIDRVTSLSQGDIFRHIEARRPGV